MAESARVLRHAGSRRRAWRTLPVLAGRYMLPPVAILGLTQALLHEGVNLSLALQVGLAPLIMKESVHIAHKLRLTGVATLLIEQNAAGGGLR